MNPNFLFSECMLKFALCINKSFCHRHFHQTKKRLYLRLMRQPPHRQKKRPNIIHNKKNEIYGLNQ